MQIKKYVAATLKKATQQMKAELGEEAIVLSTRVIDNDPRFDEKRVFEVTAGVEDNYDTVKVNKQGKLVTQNQNTFKDEYNNLTEKIFNFPVKKIPEIQPPKPAEIIKPKPKSNFQYEVKEIADTLIHREVQRRIVDQVIEQLNKYSDVSNPANIDNYVVSIISSFIHTSNFEINKKQKGKTIAMVGPTGVGKTTCIAKLAVISKILHDLDIGLISLDTYRLGAVDQLKIFSEISNIDLRIAYEPNEIPAFINEFRKKDLIFIDTAGRSQNNTQLLNDANKFLNMVKVDEVYLVMSATSTTRHMLDCAEKFKVLNYNGFVFTKLDEAVSFGNILNVVHQFDAPIKYLTNGQIIPDDIIAADPEFIANMIFTGKIVK